MQYVEYKPEIESADIDFIGSKAESIPDRGSQSGGFTEKFSSFSSLAWRYLSRHWIRAVIVSCICIVFALLYLGSSNAALRDELSQLRIEYERLQTRLSTSQNRIANLRSKLDITENKLERSQWIISNTKRPVSVHSPSFP